MPHSHQSGSRIAVPLLFAFVALLLTLVGRSVDAADPPQPSWYDGSSCETHQCANISTFKTWSNTDGEASYYFFAQQLRGSGDVNTTIWYIGDNFDRTWAEQRNRENYNVVQLFLRGMEKTWPRIMCSDENYNQKLNCFPNAKCASEIKDSGVDLSSFSLSETARDINWAITKLGSSRNIIVAEGFGTFVAHRVLSLYPNWDSLAVIMLDYTNPTVFDAYESFLNFDTVMQQVLSLCDAQNDCVSRVGAYEGSWNRLVNVVKAARAGELPCLSRLGWDVADKATELSNILSLMLKNPASMFVQSESAILSGIPSFIYRLQRCESDDINAINTLRDYVARNPQSSCPVDIPHHYNWIVNENVLRPPASPKSALAYATKSHYVLPNFSTVNALYEFYSGLPHYNDSTSNSLSNPSRPLLLVSVDMDAPFSESMAATVYSSYTSATYVRFKNTMGGKLMTGPASTCVTHQMSYYRAYGNFQSEKDSGCASTNSAVPFVNVDAGSFYGVRDAWRYTVPNKPLPSADEPQPTVDPGTDCNHVCHSSVNGAAIVLGIFFCMALAGVCVLAYMLYKKANSARFSDDFYSNLNR